MSQSEIKIDCSRAPDWRERVLLYARLVRFDRPIGIFLLMWPALWALWIAGEGSPPWQVVLIFVGGVALMRSAGCAINDFADRDFDGHVARTRGRPIAAGLVSPTEALGVSDSRRLLSLVTALPHGVLAMSNEIEGLVETSTNLAVIREREGRVFVLMSSRSSVMSALAALRQRIRSFAYLSGSDLEEKDGYPAWQPDVNSPLLKVVRQVHERIAGEAEVGAVHAGLECGIVGEKYPGMDMISFGPQIEFPHSPDERVKVASVGEFYEVVKAVLEELAGA